MACADALDPEVDAFVAAGFRLETVFPADDPATVVLSYGTTAIRLVRGRPPRPVHVRIESDGAEPRLHRTPGGSIVEVVSPDDRMVVPDARPAVVVTRPDDGTWMAGRAGMRYRDLLPGRWGGRYVASHIHIPDGGPVPDYVHFHRIRFQLIAVLAGWVDVVYEDQGPPFRMSPGDAVLQPPTIRHRVLRSSPDLEVIEIGSPADHVTAADHELTLPTSEVRPDRDFGGQRFARFVLADGAPGRWRVSGFHAVDTGFGGASAGAVGARLVEVEEVAGVPDRGAFVTDGELTMFVVLGGRVGVRIDGHDEGPLPTGGAVALPAGAEVELVSPTPDLRLLDVVTPG